MSDNQQLTEEIIKKEIQSLHRIKRNNKAPHKHNPTQVPQPLKRGNKFTKFMGAMTYFTLTVVGISSPFLFYSGSNPTLSAIKYKLGLPNHQHKFVKEPEEDDEDDDDDDEL